MRERCRLEKVALNEVSERQSVIEKTSKQTKTISYDVITSNNKLILGLFRHTSVHKKRIQHKIKRLK